MCFIPSSCFCLGNIPRDGECGSCQGSPSCQHLNRICSGCSHLTHSIPCFQSIFQSFYLSLKAFNCFLSVSELESAQVSGWRYPLGQGIVARSSCEGPYLLGWRASLPRAVQVAHSQFQSEGFGSLKEKRRVGRLSSPSGWLSTSQKCFPNHRPGRGREKMWEEPLGAQIPATVFVTGFGIASQVSLLSLGAMPETWRSLHSKHFLSSYPSAIRVALNYSEERGRIVK